MVSKLKILVCTFLSTLILVSFSTPAFAERSAASCERKGSLAAESTELDRSSYVDGSAYDNPLPQVDIVRIGLDYNDRAVDAAIFTNTTGQGFAVGLYSTDRTFTEITRTEESSVMVSTSAWDRQWHVLLDGEYRTAEKAEAVAASYGGFVQKIGGKYRVLYGIYMSQEEAEETIDRFRLPGSAYTPDKIELRVMAASDWEILFTADELQSSVAVFPIGGGPTQYNKEVYRGGFACVIYEDTRLTVINYVGLEDYVKGVIPYEMNYNWPYEALRAQAVCARTYVVYNQGEYEELGFDITGDTYSQVYRGMKAANETTDLAVDSTAEQYIRYRGEICEIYYSAADGGATEDGVYVFDAGRPYLTGKIDPFEKAIDFSLKTWSEAKSGEYIAARLALDEYEIGPVTELRPEYSDTGNVLAITFVDEEDKKVRISGRRCYTILGLYSPHFTVEEDGKDGFIFTGGGLGHGCGMSQWGAYAMAAVYGYDYEDIIRFYFTGAYIA